MQISIKFIKRLIVLLLSFQLMIGCNILGINKNSNSEEESSDYGNTETTFGDYIEINDISDYENSTDTTNANGELTLKSDKLNKEFLVRVVNENGESVE